MTTREKKRKSSKLEHKLLFADSHVGLEITNYLLNNFPQDISGVVTTSKNDIYNLACKANKKVYIFEDNITFIESLPKNIDLGLLIWWPFIIKSPLLEFPKKGFLNTHPSLLPNNKGKNPNFWSIVESRPFGVTIHKIDSGIDTGLIIAQKEIPYDWTDTGESLYKKALSDIIELFKATYPEIRLRLPRLMPQSGDGSFHYQKELEPAKEIDLNREYFAKDLINLLRAGTFEAYPSCFFKDNGEVYEIRLTISRK
jgi:methionyl-tRNA formyltransferase